MNNNMSKEELRKAWNVYVPKHLLPRINAFELMMAPYAVAHMKLMFHNQEIEGTASGDGVIDAAFNSVEQATGRHFELDDFQIQSVTEGREAMGETVVRLRWEGKLYSGRGISTDIVGAGIMAYINAVNKIVYEEEEA